MAIHYIDLNGGNDSNDGSSFANRKKTFDGLISENDNTNNAAQESLIGDEFRVMETPVVNTGLNATWVSGGIDDYNADGSLNTELYINNVTGTSPLEVTTTVAHGYSTGDVVGIRGIKGVHSAMGSWVITVTGTTTFTLNGSKSYGDTYVTWTNQSRVIKISHKCIKVNTACKQLFGGSGVAATYDDNYNSSQTRPLMGVASTNATITRRSWVGVNQLARLQISDSFGTGKVWYYTLPETTDLSAYQRISMMMHNRNNSDTQTSHISFKLCTDTTGDVAAHSFSIAGHPNHGMYAEVHDFNTNLNSAIKSIALYVDTDVGAEDIRFFNIIALKDSNDAISHQDVFSKNTTAEPVWWNAQHILTDHIIFGEPSYGTLDTMQRVTSTNFSTYAGTSETAALYKITPFNPNQAGVDFSQSELDKLTIRIRMDSRYYLTSNPNNYSYRILGGWNTTDMSTRTGVTWIYWGNHSATFVNNVDNQNNQNGNIENFGVTGGGGTFILLYGSYATIKNIYSAGFRNSNPIHFGTWRGRHAGDALVDGLYETMGYYHGVGGSGTQGGNTHTRRIMVKDWHFYGGGSLYDYVSNPPESGIIYDKVTLKSVYWLFRVNNNDRGNIYIRELDLTAGYAFYGSCSVLVDKATISRLLAEYYPDSVNYYGVPYMNEVALGNVNGDANDHRVYVPNGCIKTETTVRHSSDGVAWKIQPKIEHTGDRTGIPIYNTDRNPLSLGVANVYCSANKLVTVKAYLRRTNTAITARLAVRTYRHTNAFITTSDVVSAMTAAADTWQEVTLTITPISNGIVGIDFEAFGGNSHTAYIDSVSITQAP